MTIDLVALTEATVAAMPAKWTDADARTMATLRRFYLKFMTEAGEVAGAALAFAVTYDSVHWDEIHMEDVRRFVAKGLIAPQAIEEATLLTARMARMARAQLILQAWMLSADYPGAFDDLMGIGDG